MDFTQAMAIMLRGGRVTVVNNEGWKDHYISYKDEDFVNEDGENVTLFGRDIMGGDWQEVVLQLITDEEREYLKAVIKPFRDRVDCIRVARFADGDCLAIVLTGVEDDTFLPKFPMGTTYKGLQRGKHYTLQELGL